MTTLKGVPSHWNKELVTREICGLLNPASPEVMAGNNSWFIAPLKDLGWVEGDPLPGNISGYFAAICDLLGKKTTPMSILEIIQMEEVAETLRVAIAKTHGTHEYNKKIDEELAKKIPPRENFRVNDTNYEDLKALAIQSIEEDIATGKIDMSTVIQEQPEPVVESEVKQSKPVVDMTEDSTVTEYAPDEHITHMHPMAPTTSMCPRCQLDLTQEYIHPEVSPTDKRNYLFSVLGNHTFEKTVSLMNGAVTATYSTMNPYELDVFLKSLQAYERKFPTVDVGTMTLEYNNYRLCLMLKSFKTLQGFEYAKPEIPYEPKLTEAEIFAVYYKTWQELAIVSTALRNILFKGLRDFIILHEKLDSELENEDFWQEVATA